MSTAPVAPAPNETTRRQWVAWLRPSHVETDYEVRDVEGEIPRELQGTLYRNGPSQRQLPPQGEEALHLFDGDGYVHAFRFEDGRAFYRSRFVRDASFLAEEKEGRFCMDGLNVKAENPLPETGRVQHNTNIVSHAGRLFALVENGMPFELDPQTLEPLGLFDMGGRAVGMSTSAHPKTDGRTGEMVIHGYQPVEPFASLYVLDAGGNVTLAETLDMPWPGMMHDLAITENYVILPLGPIVFDVSVMAEGGLFRDALKWDKERPLTFGIRSREPGSPMRFFDAPTAGYMFHPGNAYEEDGVIHMDACTYLDGDHFVEDLCNARSGTYGNGLVAHPFLYEFDLATGECRERKLSDRSAEFPRLDERRVGYENRYGYAAVGDPADAKSGGIWTDLTRYDRTGGPSVYRQLPAGHFTGEPVFVPRTPEAAEEDGFVLAMIYDAPNDRSGLLVLDAQNLAGEALATLWLRDRVPAGFHGNYVAG
jgi:carotenoid cleavage dioxygenase